MALIIGDLHGNLAKVRDFLDFKPEEEHICIGDYVDSFTASPRRQLECLHLLIDSGAVMLWGNHDIHYLPNPPWICSGFQTLMASKFGEIYSRALKSGRIKAAHAADGWLCTHAGVHPYLIEQEMKPEQAAEMLNRMFIEQMRAGHGPLFNLSPARGGGTLFGGIFWFDPFREGVEPSDKAGRQVFGHTEHKEPYISEKWVCIDTTNSPNCWVFDTTSGTVLDIRNL